MAPNTARRPPRASSDPPRPRAAVPRTNREATLSGPRGTGTPKLPRRTRSYTRRRSPDRSVRGATRGIRRAGAEAVDLVEVAAGRLDGFWELTLAPWDVAAGGVLIREAGGVVTTLDGSPDVLQHGSIVAGNPSLHKWLMDLLRSA